MNEKHHKVLEAFGQLIGKQTDPDRLIDMINTVEGIHVMGILRVVELSLKSGKPGGDYVAKGFVESCKDDFDTNLQRVIALMCELSDLPNPWDPTGTHNAGVAAEILKEISDGEA